MVCKEKKQTTNLTMKQTISGAYMNYLHSISREMRKLIFIIYAFRRIFFYLLNENEGTTLKKISCINVNIFNISV